jgi:hypothetical protein
MKLPSVLLLLVIVAVALAIEWPTSKTARLNLCQMEAIKAYVSKIGDTQNGPIIVLAQLLFTSHCMKGHNYNFDSKLPGCDGAQPQGEEKCYTYDWRSAFGLPSSN